MATTSISKDIQQVGKEGEELFKEYLNKNEIEFLEINQENDSSYSKKAQNEDAKRPDFIIPSNIFYSMFLQQNNKIPLKPVLVDVKHHKMQTHTAPNWGTFDYFSIDIAEINKAINTEKLYQMEFWFVFKDNQLKNHYNWYAIKASDIISQLNKPSNTNIFSNNPNIINIKITAMTKI
jgi:hypothetical protein